MPIVKQMCGVECALMNLVRTLNELPKDERRRLKDMHDNAAVQLELIQMRILSMGRAVLNPIMFSEPEKVDVMTQLELSVGALTIASKMAHEDGDSELSWFLEMGKLDIQYLVEMYGQKVAA